MSDEFLRRDVHEANLAEIKALMQANLSEFKKIAAEMKCDNTEINARLEGVIDTFSVAINDINSRIDDMKDNQSQTLSKWAIAIAILVGAVQIVISILLNFWK